MRLPQRFAPIVAIVTSKTVVIAACAAIALFLGALSAGSLVFLHKKLPFSLGKPSDSTIEPGRRPAASKPNVAAAETENAAAAKTTVSGNTAAVISQHKNAPSSARPPDTGVPATGAMPAPDLPPALNLPPISKPPADTTQPVPTTIPHGPVMPSVMAPGPNTSPLGLDVGIDLTVHIGLPLL